MISPITSLKSVVGSSIARTCQRQFPGKLAQKGILKNIVWEAVPTVMQVQLLRTTHLTR